MSADASRRRSRAVLCTIQSRYIVVTLQHSSIVVVQHTHSHGSLNTWKEISSWQILLGATCWPFAFPTCCAGIVTLRHFTTLSGVAMALFRMIFFPDEKTSSFCQPMYLDKGAKQSYVLFRVDTKQSYQTITAQQHCSCTYGIAKDSFQRLLVPVVTTTYFGPKALLKSRTSAIIFKIHIYVHVSMKGCMAQHTLCRTSTTYTGSMKLSLLLRPRSERCC